jgi:hypothetical protein
LDAVFRYGGPLPFLICVALYRTAAELSFTRL